MSPTHRVWIAIVTLSGLSACSKGLDTGELERQIAATLVERTGVAAKTVTCPRGVEEKEGGTFTCTATADDGTSARVNVTMLGHGQVDWKVAGGRP